MTSSCRRTSVVEGGSQVERMVLEAARLAFEDEVEDEEYQGEPFGVCLTVEIAVAQGQDQEQEQ